MQGGIYNAASAVNWARSLGLFTDYNEIDDFTAESAIARGLVFVPALSGLSCPYWDRRAAGLWLGMGLETTKADMMQALLEGVALLAETVMAAIDKHFGHPAPMPRAGLPDEIGPVGAFLASRGTSYMTGANINVDGGRDFT